MVEPVTLRLRGASKRYGDCVVVTDVSFEARPREIRVLVGENGAGKSSALRIMAGLLAPDRGTVLAGDAPIAGVSPRLAKAHGVALVAQHFSLVEGLTALENVVLGAPPTGRFGELDLAGARRDATRILGSLGVAIDLDADVGRLGVGERQRLEIARALYGNATTLLLDEPTAILTSEEADALYAVLRRLADEGRGIVVVTHKLAEIRRHADAVTVLRRGKVTLDEGLARGAVDDATMDRIERAILGDAAVAALGAEVVAPGAEVARLTAVRTREAAAPIDLAVRIGEVVAVAGVTGNGQDDLVAILTGRAPVEGAVRLPAEIAVVHEDRHREGLALDAPLVDNVLLGELARFSRYGILDVAAMRAEATRRLEAAAVTASGVLPDPDATARSLSGGNQQKVVCARAFARVDQGATLLVLAHPTRGVDKGAAATIHRGILAARAKAGVVLVSADLAELRLLASRLFVIVRGALLELPLDASDDTIGRAMLGEGA